MAAAFDPVYGEAWNSGQCLATFALPGYQWFGVASPDDAARLGGFALCRSVAGESELLLLAVNPYCRRMGLAQALLQAWTTRCRASGVTRQFLEVRADNPALDLYVAAGFAGVARRPDYYRGGDGQLRDAITMERAV